jgi:hypothetical protein
MSTSTSSITPTGPLATAPVAARARRILSVLHAQLVQALANPLKLTVVELERELFRQAERARSSQAQSELYAEMRKLRDHAEQFRPAMEAGLAVELATLRTPKQLSRTGHDGGAFQPLTLVEDTDIDRDIVLGEIARREAARCASTLQLLGQRFGVLAALPALELEQVPLGPHALCRVLRQAGEALDLNLDTQLTLYRVFERQTLERLGELLDRANIVLAHEGVLPGLVYQPYLPKPSNARRRGGQDASPGARGTGGPRPLTGWTGQAPTSSWSQAMAQALLPGGGGDADAADAGATPAGTEAQADGAASGAGTPSQSGTEAADLPGALRQLLASARRHPAASTNAAGATVTAGAPASSAGASPQAGGAPTPDIASDQGAPAASSATSSAAATGGATTPVPASALAGALDLLQARSSAGHPMPTPAKRSIGEVRQQLLAMLREAHGPQAGLSQQDTDTFDLLGLLYGEIEREVRSSAPAAELLVRLQVPLARAALQDRAFFVRDQHPARELLNAVAESGATWLGDDDSDPQLLQKLAGAVDKVVDGYQGDEAVFEAANQEIQAHHKAQARKAEVTERRHVEAARGKERLELAKRLAGDSIEHVCAQTAPPKFVQSLLRQAWSDVLTLTLLRQGEQSEDWAARQHLTDRIAEATVRPAGEPADAALGEEVEAALLQVGYHRDEASAIARRLSTPGGEDSLTSRTELTAKLKARARLGDQPEAPRKEPPAPRSAAESACYAQLRALPFGTWFEFVTNQQGDAKRQRLSWYSPVTDHALFVNARGQKINECSLDALAKLMAHGQARILTEERGRLIDRAWQATVRALRTLSGAATPQEGQA